MMINTELTSLIGGIHKLSTLGGRCRALPHSEYLISQYHNKKEKKACTGGRNIFMS